MLEDIDTSHFISNSVYKRDITQLETKLGVLHRQVKDLGFPMMVVFEGWEVSGKASMINRVLMSMDPRNYSVHPIQSPVDDELLRPFLWRFWVRTPPKGRIAIFDRSWYMRVSDDRVENKVKKSMLPSIYDMINSFERQLTDDGTLMVKIFLHITRKEQERRLRKLQEEKETPWRYLPQSWDHHKHYDDYLKAYDDMLVRTHTKWAPWHIIPAHDRRLATVEVFKAIVSAIESRRLESITGGRRSINGATHEEDGIPRVLSTVRDLPQMDLAEYETALSELQNRLVRLQAEVYERKVPVIIVYSGMDAAGKGGNIKRLVQKLDPRGYKVIPIIVPTDEEKAHHYLWRFWKELPPAGRMAIFDRSWYGRVMVERIEGFCTEDEWRRAYREIIEMEEQWVDEGAVLMKFWLNIDAETQLERFNERMNNPYKRWKITDEDWRNRSKWDHYILAADEMIYSTSTEKAPWTIVEANSKYHSRISTLSSIASAIEVRLKG